MADTANEGYLAVAKQTTQGTGVAPTAGVLARSFGLGLESELLTGDREIGSGRDVDRDNAIAGTYSVAGSVATDARFTQMGFFLLGLGFVQSGAPVAAGAPNVGAYTHTFIPATGDPTFLTVEGAWGRNRIIRRWIDCLVDSATWSVTGGEVVTFETDIVGLTESLQASPAVPTYPVPDPKGAYNGCALTLGALGSTFRFADFNLTIANNIDTDRAVIGQRSIADLVPGGRDVTLGGTIELTTATNAAVKSLYQAAAYGDPAATSPQDVDPFHTSAVATFGSKTKIVTGGTLFYGIDFTLPDVVLSAPALESTGADVVSVPFEGRAFRGGSPVATITLRNARATAY